MLSDFRLIASSPFMMRYVPATFFRLRVRGIFNIPTIGRIRARSIAGLTRRGYEDAIDALNSLQTPFKVLEARRLANIRPDEEGLKEMRTWLRRIGHSNHDLDSLNIVHVAGSKGKGTTCAYTSSILNFHRVAYSIPSKTGLFTSPHLVSVRERIRINESPISEQLFAKYFFEVWDLLESTAIVQNLSIEDKPVYFRYLTLMSMHAFIREGVEVAIYEVGIGGQFDSTNIIDHPAVTGISALGIDHVFLLGDTVDKIAWHKAGIMKTSSPAFTVNQAPEAAAVLQQRAEEKGVALETVGIDSRLRGVSVMPNADFQKRNASLAIRLAETVLTKVDSNFKIDEQKLPRSFVDGLEQAVWRGRCEIKIEGNMRWHLDGAHTSDSLKFAAKWFGEESSQHPGKRVLIFNQQGRTEAPELLGDFFNALKAQGLVKFDHAVFCANTTYAKKGYKKDFVNHTYDAEAITKLSMQKELAEKWRELDPHATVAVMASIEEAMDYAKALMADESGEKSVQTCITGSLHLVGGALGILDGETVL